MPFGCTYPIGHGRGPCIVTQKGHGARPQAQDFGTKICRKIAKIAISKLEMALTPARDFWVKIVKCIRLEYLQKWVLGQSRTSPTAAGCMECFSQSKTKQKPFWTKKKSVWIANVLFSVRIFFNFDAHFGVLQNTAKSATCTSGGRSRKIKSGVIEVLKSFFCVVFVKFR